MKISLKKAKDDSANRWKVALVFLIGGNITYFVFASYQGNEVFAGISSFKDILAFVLLIFLNTILFSWFVCLFLAFLKIFSLGLTFLLKEFEEWLMR